MKKVFFLFFFIVGPLGLLTAQTANNCLIDQSTKSKTMSTVKNVLGDDLKPCCYDPLTGFYRDGFCNTGPNDYGTHVVCARMTEAFLTYTKNRGNDLSTPVPMYNFPGLKVGDQWCLCASRWKEAMIAGVAPPVILESTHEKALSYVSIDDLKKHALLATE